MLKSKLTDGLLPNAPSFGAGVFRSSSPGRAGFAEVIHERYRGFVPDRTVRSYRVVFSTPSLQLFSRISRAHEPVLVQAFGPEPPVERLNIRIVRQFARA